MHREHGFSLIEMTLAMGLLLIVTAGVFSMLNPAQGAFATQPEVSDMQQRLRVTTDTLYKDMVMAGGGAYQGQRSGTLLNFFAPVMPYRNGSTLDDPAGSFVCRGAASGAPPLGYSCPANSSDTITLMYVPPTMSQTGLADKGPSLNSAEIGVTAEPGCPASDPLCGFHEGMTVLMYDDSGNFDTFTITNVQAGGQLHIQHNEDKLTYTGYDKSTTKIVQATNVVYYLNATTNQLMYYDGTRNGDVPVVDNVVGLSFEYYGDPQPPIVKNPTAVSTSWVTTYGPKPTAGVANCVFDGSVQPQPLLATLGAANAGLVKLTQAQLTDGPWCPNAGSTNRYDADLLRVRRIGVTVRVQAALASLRGPASTFFAKGGTSNSAGRWVPDQEIRFQVTPRNLNLGR